MKKLLSVVLLLMLFTLCFTLASCGDGVSVDDVNENALKVLVEAAENTNNKFFASEEDESAYAAMKEAMDKGSIELGFEADDLLEGATGMELKDLGATIYFDKDSGKYAISAGASVEGNKIDGTVFIDKDGFKVMSESILGNKDTYALNIGSLIEKLEGSVLAEMMGGIPEGALDPYKEYMNAFKTEYEKIMTETEIQPDHLVNVLLKALSPAVTESTLKVGEDEIDVIVLTYTVSNKTIEAFLDAAVEEAAKIAKLDNATKEMLAGYADQAVEMLKVATINCKAEFYLIAEDNTFAKQVITGEVKANDQTVKVDLTSTYSATEMKMVETIDMMGQKMTSGITVTRATADDGAVTYKAVATGSMNQGETTVEMTVCELEASYKADGNVSVKVTIPAEITGSESNMSYELKGKLDLTDGAKFTFTEIKAGNMTIKDFKATISFNPGASAPSTGTVKDVVELTEKDFEDLQKKFENGILGALMGNGDAEDAVSGK